MKKTIRLVLLSSIYGSLSLVSAWNASAQYPAATTKNPSASTTYPSPSDYQRWYVKGDVGGNVTLDTSLKEFFGEVSPGSKVSFDPGFRIGLGAGYFVTDWFAVEGEIASLVNNICSITEAEHVDAAYWQAPFLANLRFQCPYHCFVTPYIGGGVGGSLTTIDAYHIDLNGTHFDGWMSDVTFAYQAFGGLRFRINDTMGLSVEYRYLATESSDFRADVTINTDTDHLRMGGTQSHVVSIAFDWRF